MMLVVVVVLDVLVMVVVVVVVGTASMNAGTQSSQTDSATSTAGPKFVFFVETTRGTNCEPHGNRACRQTQCPTCAGALASSPFLFTGVQSLLILPIVIVAWPTSSTVV